MDKPDLNGLLSEAGKQLAGSTTASTEQERRDAKYNRIARDQPAYIALIYPLVCLLIYLDFGKVFDTDNKQIIEWSYAFNIIVGLGIFIPALFFFFKMVARDFSVFTIEILGGCICPQCHLLMLKCKSVWLYRMTKCEREDLKKACDVSEDSEEVLDKIYRCVRDDQSVRTDPVVFDFNCFFGFYRNLSGGILMDLIFSLLLIWFDPSFYKDNEGLTNFVEGAWPWLLGLWIFLLLLTYCARINLNHRRFNVYCKRVGSC